MAWLISLCCPVDFLFDLAHGGNKALAAAKQLDDLDGGADLIEGRHLENAGLFEVLDTLVGILVQQGIQHQPRLVLEAGEVIALAHLVGAFPAGERWLAIGDVADEVEGVEFFAYLFLQGLPEHAVLLQFIEDEFLFSCLGPGVEELVEGAVEGLDVAAGVVFEGLGDELAVGVEVLDPFGDEGDLDIVDVVFGGAGIGAVISVCAPIAGVVFYAVVCSTP